MKANWTQVAKPMVNATVGEQATTGTKQTRTNAQGWRPGVAVFSEAIHRIIVGKLFAFISVKKKNMKNGLP